MTGNAQPNQPDTLPTFKGAISFHSSETKLTTLNIVCFTCGNIISTQIKYFHH